MRLKFLHDAQIDFHEFGLMDHFDVEKLLTEFIEDEYMKGNKALLIITGTGKMVKPLVAKLLKTNKFVKESNEAGYFNGQKGAYEVTLKS